MKTKEVRKRGNLNGKTDDDRFYQVMGDSDSIAIVHELILHRAAFLESLRKERECLDRAKKRIQKLKLDLSDKGRNIRQRLKKKGFSNDYIKGYMMGSNR